MDSERRPGGQFPFLPGPSAVRRSRKAETKTGPETRYAGVRTRPADLTSSTLAELRDHAERLFVRLQCRDYARFDFRADADGAIKLLEVDPNPAWSSAGKLAAMAGYAGKSYPELLEMLLDAAWARYDRRVCAPTR